jgi:ArsR family transcriptional regulator
MEITKSIYNNYGTIPMTTDYDRPLPEIWRRAVRLFSALGDEHRQRILLSFAPRERLNVGQLVSVSPLSRSAVSHHLKILREAGVLNSRKEGKEVYFWINKEYVEECLAAVLEHLHQRN